MLDILPLEIREIIFSCVRYTDFFETARVSQGWWTLTMASFDRFLHKEDDFLLDQVDFCNQMMPKKTLWEWWKFMVFTKSKALYLDISDFHALVSHGKGRLIRYFSSKDIHVKHLKVHKRNFWSSIEVLRLPPNLDEVFPCLKSLEVDALALESPSTIVFPLHLTSLRFGLERMPSTVSIALKTSELTVLDLKECGFESFYLLDALKFDNLTRLSVSAYGLFEMELHTRFARILKYVLLENKTLRSVSFRYAYVTKEWWQIFPANVVEIELFEPRLNHDLVKAFGNNVFYERLLLMYVCENWTLVVKFRTYSMSWETYHEEEVNDEEMDDENEDEYDDDEESNEGGDDNGIGNAYQVQYMCRPTANKEAIFVKRSNVAINEFITKNNQGLVLTTLKYYQHSYDVPIPPNVRYLSILEDLNENDDDNQTEFELVLEDPTVLQTLIGRLTGLHFTDPTSTFPNMINLRVLDIFDCDENLFVSILHSCTSLSKLTLNYPGHGVFRDISSDIKSVSLQCLTIIGGGDTFEDILKHLPSLNSLTLEECCEVSILKSDTDAIKHLQYFELCIYGNKEIAVHLSTLQFPYMLFVVKKGLHSYTASKGLELVNELSRQVSKKNIAKFTKRFFLYFCNVANKAVPLVYARNIATRFMRNTCHLVNTVQDFIDKLQSATFN